MEQQQNGKAMASLMLGILAILCVLGGIVFFYSMFAGFILGSMGILLAFFAKKENASRISTAGLVLSLVAVSVCVISVIAMLAYISAVGKIAAETSVWNR